MSSRLWRFPLLLALLKPGFRWDTSSPTGTQGPVAAHTECTSRLAGGESLISAHATVQASSPASSLKTCGSGLQLPRLPCSCQLSAPPRAEGVGYGLQILLHFCYLLDAFNTPINGLFTSLASLCLIFVHLLNHECPLPQSRPRPCHDGSSSLIPNSPLPDNHLIKPV